MKYLLTFLLLIQFSFSVNAQLCTNNNRFSEVPYFTDGQITVQYNITYANAIDWMGTNKELKLDVYYPTLAIDSLPLRPLILMVHGGGLISGNKNAYTNVCKEFAKRGFVAATIDYRLGLNCATDTIAEEKAKYRAQQDINAAFRFVVQNAATIRIDTSWMFVGGGSAGSVASLGVVYISQSEWNVFTPSLQPLLGNLNNSGNTLNNRFSLKGIFNDWGAMLKASMQKSEMLPMISFHGDADATVNIDSSFGGGCIHVDKSYGSRAMHNLLVSNGVCSDLSVKPGGLHGVYEDSAVGVPFRVGRAACFFKSLFCNNCASFSQTQGIGAKCSVTTGVLNNDINDIKVYPNPFKDKINLSNLRGNEYFNLINQLGQIIYEGKSIQSQNFSFLNKGIYYLRIQRNESTSLLKLAKIL